MSATETFQVSTEAARFYEEKFVPALFGEWADHVVEAVEAREGQALLDVACGTGIVARAAADVLGNSGRVVGVDLNEGMLAIARGIRPDLEWHRGDAADLPFPTGSFDAALCQAALMYFPDRAGAVSEMARVVKPGGAVAIQVWGSLDRQPAYLRFADVVSRHAGGEGADLVGSYFSLGDLGVLSELLARAGVEVTATRTRTGTVRFGSIDEFVAAEVESTPLIDRIDEEAYARIKADCGVELAEYASDGRTEIPIEGHILVGRHIGEAAG